MIIDPTDAIALVAEKLRRIDEPFAFLGGAIVGFLVDDPAAVQIRPTKDVDVIVQVLAWGKYADFEQRLRDLGFKNDISKDAPICRWWVDGVTVDIMPDKPEALRMPCLWFSEALKAAVPVEIKPGFSVPIVTVPYFVATKLEAFRDRGHGDYQASHDLEDLITVIDGRSDFATQVLEASDTVRAFITAQFHELLNSSSFMDALHGHLPPDPVNQQRVSIVRRRIQEVAASNADEHE